eukprot:TRINITY_DN7374_c0_g1_i2.p1 TRINITY_DN7374_c0_g1~~TRINITY_DN7374_c0_g1_i2.p1  ORF type:complete len:919 (+),score=279.61 TRINITY_DN7374_c0_g1_i2:62-2818(+)
MPSKKNKRPIASEGNSSASPSPTAAGAGVVAAEAKAADDSQENGVAPRTPRKDVADDASVRQSLQELQEELRKEKDSKKQMSEKLAELLRKQQEELQKQKEQASLTQNAMLDQFAQQTAAAEREHGQTRQLLQATEAKLTSALEAAAAGNGQATHKAADETARGDLTTRIASLEEELRRSKEEAQQASAKLREQEETALADKKVLEEMFEGERKHLLKKAEDEKNELERRLEAQASFNGDGNLTNKAAEGGVEHFKKEAEKEKLRREEVERQSLELQSLVESLEADCSRVKQAFETLLKKRRKEEEARRERQASKPPAKSQEEGAKDDDAVMKRRNFSLSTLPEDEASGVNNAQAEKQIPRPEMQEAGGALRRVNSISCLELVMSPEKKGQVRQEQRRAPPRYMTKDKNVPVVIVTSEISPWSKTGGLGMVTASLAYEFGVRGRKTVAVSPMYRDYANCSFIGETRIWLNGADQLVKYFHLYQEYSEGCGCDYIFVAHDCYRRSGGLYCSDAKAGKEYDDNLFRFGLLSLAALEAPFVLRIRGQPPLGERVTFLANDWQAGLVPIYLRHKYRRHGTYKQARSLYVVHNMGYQGRYSQRTWPLGPVLGLDEAAASDLRFGSETNLSKGAIETCDRMVTVSPTYAEEIQTQQGGFGLHDLCRKKKSMGLLVGILNGIDDSWDPRTDPHIAMNYTLEDYREGKMQCKAQLQRRLGLEENQQKPLVGFVGRLTSQKGIDMLTRIVPWLMQETGNGVTGNVQLIMMGDGEQTYCDMLHNAQRLHQRQICGYVGFDPVVEHQMMAGCDFLIMPSRYEPCGLPQMYCQAYGTVPIVHSTGGLRDSVIDPGPNRTDEKATGFLVCPLTENDMKRVVYQALETYVRQPSVFQKMQTNALRRDFYWPQAIDEYERQMDDAMMAPLSCP